MIILKAINTVKRNIPPAIKYKRFIKDSNKGNLFFRRTIRKSLESGGSFEKLIFKPRIKKKPKLTILCDISGSMALNSLFGVTLLYGMVSKFKSIKAFVFIDGATEISKTLRLIKKNEIHIISICSFSILWKCIRPTTQLSNS